MSTRNRSRAGSAAGYLMNMVPNAEPEKVATPAAAAAVATPTKSAGEGGAAKATSTATSTESTVAVETNKAVETTPAPAESSNSEKAAAKANRMCLAVYPENALYLEAVTTMRGTNKTALINEAIAAMRANDPDWDALKAAYETLTAFRK